MYPSFVNNGAHYGNIQQNVNRDVKEAGELWVPVRLANGSEPCRLTHLPGVGHCGNATSLLGNSVDNVEAESAVFHSMANPSQDLRNRLEMQTLKISKFDYMSGKTVLNSSVLLNNCIYKPSAIKPSL